MNYFDPIRKNFQVGTVGGITGKILRAINWFRGKMNKEPINMTGGYNRKTGELNVYLGTLKNVYDNPEFSEDALVDIISDTLTHEYLHKVTMEDPVFAREWKKWVRSKTNNPISARLKDDHAQELVAHGMMDNQMMALRQMSEHFAVEPPVREAANKVYQDVLRQAKQNDMKTNQWAKENGINPRLKMWEFLEASNKADNQDVSKFDSLHHSATMQGSLSTDDDSWFNILRMGGAVTSTSSGTSALFNNKTGGGKRRGKRKKSVKRQRYQDEITRRDRRYNQRK